MFKALYELSDDHKEILYFSAVRLYNSIKIAELRGQSDRNIRKVRNHPAEENPKKDPPAFEGTGGTGASYDNGGTPLSGKYAGVILTGSALKKYNDNRFVSYFDYIGGDT